MQICSTKPVRSALLIFALLAALTLAACGDDGEGGSEASEGADPATLAPADAVIYIDAFVRPEGERRENLDAVLGTLLGTDDVGAELEPLLEEELGDEGSISYTEDVKPWLGERVGIFFSELSEEPDGALIATVTDEGAAEDFIQTAADADDVEERDASYEGVDYMVDEDGTAIGLVEGFLVAGTEPGLQAAVDAAAGEGFAGSAAADAVDVDETTIFTFVGNIELILDALEEQGELPGETRKQLEEQLGDDLDQPFAITGSVLEDGLAIGFDGPPGAETSDTALVSAFPSGSWLAFASADFSDQLDTFFSSFEAGFKAGFEGTGTAAPDISAEQALDQLRAGTGLDLEKDLGWIGDLGGFIQGSSIFGLGGGIVLEADDEDAAADAIAKFRDAVESSGQVQTGPLAGGAEGFSAQVAGAPLGFEVELRDGKVVIAGGAADVDSVLEPDSTLGDDSRFQSALDSLDGGSPNFYLDFPVLVDLLESTGQTADPELQQALPVLRSLDYLIAGGEAGSGRLVLGVRDAEPTGEAAVIAPPIP